MKVVILVASVLLRTRALLGRTDCQLKSSRLGSDWLEVHCSTTDSSGDGDIVCYYNSETIPHLGQQTEPRGGNVTAVFLVNLVKNDSQINCCSVSNSSASQEPSLCLDFVYDNRHVVTTTTTLPSTEPSRSPMSDQTITMSPTSQIKQSPRTTTDGSREVTPGGDNALEIFHNINNNLSQK